MDYTMARYCAICEGSFPSYEYDRRLICPECSKRLNSLLYPVQIIETCPNCGGDLEDRVDEDEFWKVCPTCRWRARDIRKQWPGIPIKRVPFGGDVE